MNQRDLAGPEELASIQRIGSRLRGELSRRRARRRRGQTLAAISVSAVVGASLTAGAFVLIASQEERVYSAYCYSGETTESVYTQATLPEPIDSAGDRSERTAPDALELCAAMWSSGVIGQEQSPDDPNAHRYPVPELQVCLRNDGVRAVFPSSDSEICEALGLQNTAER